MTTKHLTILHSNDIHADFSHKDKEGKLRENGGIAYLGGYIGSKRAEAPESTLYVFAGDMFNGSLIDQDSKGYNSINIMNLLKPDVATIGNHELDYQFTCLSYYKDRCTFPLICSNVYDRALGDLFFRPYVIKNANGMNILFIGVVTQEVEKRAGKDIMVKLNLIWLDPKEQIVKYYKEVTETKGIDIHMTVVLSHLGIDKDRELAKELSEENDCKVDLIIGGHSHTNMTDKEEVGGIWIAQAYEGTAQVGRFEIDYDLSSRTIVSSEWHLDPIVNSAINPDRNLLELIDSYEKEITKKYKQTLAKLKKLDKESGDLVPANAEHVSRYKGTEVGNMICDALAEHYKLDIVIIGSGSLRKKEMRSDVTKAEVMEMYSFEDEKLYMIFLTGKELKKAMETALAKAPVYRPDDEEDHHEEFFQVSWGYYFEYSSADGKLVKATHEGTEISDDEVFKVGIEGYHLNNLEEHLGLKNIEEIKSRRYDGMLKRKKSANIQYSIKEYMKEHQMVEILNEVRVLKV